MPIFIYEFHNKIFIPFLFNCCTMIPLCYILKPTFLKLIEELLNDKTTKLIPLFILLKISETRECSNHYFFHWKNVSVATNVEKTVNCFSNFNLLNNIEPTIHSKF